MTGGREMGNNEFSWSGDHGRRKVSKVGGAGVFVVAMEVDPRSGGLGGTAPRIYIISCNSKVAPTMTKLTLLSLLKCVAKIQ